MKYFLIIAVAVVALTGCKDDVKTDAEPEAINTTAEVSEIKKATYPESVSSILTAHGSIEAWNTMNNLCFEMDGSNGKEIHTISLRDRKSKIEHENWTIGYDGNEVWLLENEPEAYEGNARFYHNLMFYFYAMPFVLGDDGINYTAMEPQELEGKMYTATKISYNAGIGDAPDDEYILYSDPATNQMVWLGYTVTFKSGEKSDQWSFIKYDKWQEVNGLQLPEKLTWYNVKDGKPQGEKKDRRFNKITMTETQLDHEVFEKPLGAVVVPR